MNTIQLFGQNPEIHIDITYLSDQRLAQSFFELEFFYGSHNEGGS